MPTLTFTTTSKRATAPPQKRTQMRHTKKHARKKVKERAFSPSGVVRGATSLHESAATDPGGPAGWPSPSPLPTPTLHRFPNTWTLLVVTCFTVTSPPHHCLTTATAAAEPWCPTLPCFISQPRHTQPRLAVGQGDACEAFSVYTITIRESSVVVFK